MQLTVEFLGASNEVIHTMDVETSDLADHWSLRNKSEKAMVLGHRYALSQSDGVLYDAYEVIRVLNDEDENPQYGRRTARTFSMNCFD